MKATKRIISVLLAAVMIATSFVAFGGCSGGAGGNGDLVTIDVYTQLANYSGIQGGWIGTVLADKFGVQVNIVPDGEGVYETRVESGNLGDIVIWGSDGEQYQNAVNLGLLYDWEEDDLVKEYGPYIYENMQNALENNRKISGDGTKVYGFGHGVASDMTDHEAFFYNWDIRWDLYKELGYPEVTDLDSMVELFKAMKEICPTDDNGNESYAMSLWPDWDGDMVMYVKAMATAYYGYDELAGGLFDSDTGEFHPALEENGPYLEMLAFFNELYRNDLLDPDSMTATYDTATEKVRNSGVFFQIFDYAGSNVYNTEEHMAENRIMMPLVAEEATPPAYGMSIYGGNRIWSIGSECADPELCMEIINWFCTPQGTMAIWYGIQGLMWDYDDEGGIYYTELGKKCSDDPQTELDGIEWTSPDTGKTYTLGGTFNDGTFQANNITWSQNAKNPESKKNETFYDKFWASELGDPKCDIEADWRNFTGAVGPQQYLESTNYRVIKAYSGWTETAKDDTLKTSYEQIKKCIVNNSWQAIYAESEGQFNYIVQNMIKQCDAYGYADYVEWAELQAANKFAAQIG